MFDKLIAEGNLKTDYTCPHCHGEGQIQLPHRSPHSYTPKMATTLQLLQEILDRGEQAVVFSAFNDPLDTLARRLREAGVRHLTLDGRTSQKRRGDASAVFKRGRYQAAEGDPAIPVLLAGVECMAEGHSWHLANNVILIAYSWAYDKFIQALNRVHRMTSPRPVNVYVVIANGTIDRKLEALIGEKGDAAELVLDGQLLGERQEEVNLAELLNIARREFNAEDNTIDEARLEQDWPNLCKRLHAAQQQWDATAPTRELPASNDMKRLKPSSPRNQRCPKGKPTVINKPRYTPAQLAAFDQPPASTPANIVTLDGTPAAPAENILTVPGIPASAPNARTAWMQKMRARASALASAQGPDVWAQL